MEHVVLPLLLLLVVVVDSVVSGAAWSAQQLAPGALGHAPTVPVLFVGVWSIH